MHIPGHISNIINHFPAILAGGGYWLLSIIVILEGLPIIGSFFPGHVAIIASGFLAKLGVLNLGTVIIVSIISVILGDTIGYGLGRKYGYSLLRRFGKYVFLKDHHIEKTKALIDKHTGKSVIFGKLSPITRPLMPFLAGASNIKLKRFWFYNILGGVIWVVSSILLGYVFGASYKAVSIYFGKVLVLATIVAVLIIWGYRFVNKRFHIFKKYEIFVLGLNLISLWALAKTIQDSLSNSSFMANFDVWINIFMYDHARPFLVKASALIGNIFSIESMTAIGIIAGFTFIYLKWWRRATIAISSVLLSNIAVFFMKYFFMRTRPENAFQILRDPSFPSGHAALSAAFFLSIIYIFAPKIHSLVKREIFIVACVIMSILVGLSRIILNVHWVSDVVAGWSLGAFIFASSILLIRYIGFFLERRKGEDNI